MKKAWLALILMTLILAASSCAAQTGGNAGATASASAPPAASNDGTATPKSTPAGGMVSPSAASASALPSGTMSSSSSPTTKASASPSASPKQSASSPSPTADKNGVKLEGAIGGSTVHMTLTVKDGTVSGSYYYKNPEQELKLSGTVEGYGMLVMNEYDPAGKNTGKFSGTYVPGIRLTGVWTNTKTNEKLDYSLTGTIPKDAVWSGEWKRLDTGRFSSAGLVISNESASGFEFQMEAFSGANMGFLNGKAAISGAAASYKDGGTGAELTFSLSGGIVTVTANDKANGQAGMGVVFGGRYTKGALPEDTLLSLKYVTTQAQDDAFSAMTGKNYVLLLNTAYLRQDAKDLDGLGATVYTWWVRGFKGTNESIVMFLPNGKLAAAVIDPNRNTVAAYTNDAGLTAAPKTIRDWAAGFNGKTLEFHPAVKN